MSEDFTILGREMAILINEIQKSLNILNSKRSTPRHIIIQLSEVKDKERILKTAQEN